MRKTRGFWIVLFLAPALILFCSVYLVPLITVIASSFTRWNGGLDNMKFIGIENYRQVLSDAGFHKAFTNTLKWALFAAFVHVPFGVLVAMILAKKIRLWRFTRAVFMLPNLVAPTAMAILFTFLYKPDMGILNNIIQAIGFKDFNVNFLFDDRTAFMSVTFIWLLYAAVITLITMAELLSIPDSLHESARIDGANTWQIDWYINVPLLLKIIGTGMIIAITAVFKKFDIVYLTTNGGPGNETMTMSVMMVNSIINTMRFGYANTIATMLMAMGLTAMLLCQRVFRLGQSAFE